MQPISFLESRIMTSLSVTTQSSWQFSPTTVPCMMIEFLTTGAAANLDPTEDDRIFDGALNDAAIGDHRIFSLGVDAVFDRHLVTDLGVDRTLRREQLPADLRVQQLHVAVEIGLQRIVFAT